MGENEMRVSFDENGSEYTGYFTATAWARLSFYCENPRSICIDGVTITLDENINGIQVNDRDMPIDESWKYPRELSALPLQTATGEQE